MNSTGGGNYANIGQFPFMAVVNNLVGNILFKQCSGTIIHTKWVLTVAHCVENYPLFIYHQMFSVTFGIIDKPGVKYDFQGPSVSMIANRAIIHPNYTNTHFYNDIALLLMPTNIPFFMTIQPIKLVNTDENFALRQDLLNSMYIHVCRLAFQPIKLANRDENFANKNAFVLGWGGGSEKLKYAEVSVIQNTECKQAGLNTSDVTDQHVCTATGLGEDTCHSGAPLIVAPENSSYLQIGILDWQINAYSSGPPLNTSGGAVVPVVSRRAARHVGIDLYPHTLSNAARYDRPTAEDPATAATVCRGPYKQSHIKVSLKRKLYKVTSGIPTSNNRPKGQRRTIMDLKSAMVFLISLTVCQYVHSQPPIPSRRTSEKIGELEDYPDSDIDDDQIKTIIIQCPSHRKIGKWRVSSNWYFGYGNLL
ncbi:PREDICTED: atrial natriuretic peptide-converting enzyme-like [Wasmannia auropunctata]|uniref:atrial natriuretic peptide-converting enzyme-like n=1 Tax=Wasmannia auropunctata TaxID=64793 RepID=UPI0005EDCF6C|nr:PREDICTED: atrial natriuretic peptide-converting enzyme-like [Wasmannia auropunctata]